MRLHLVFTAALFALTSCYVGPPRETCPRPDLHRSVDELYRAFCFDAGAEPDWDTQRGLFHPDARFFPPAAPGRSLEARDTEQFLAEFRQYASEGGVAAKGLHERVIDVSCAGFGDVAHAAVAFEGFHPPGGAAVTRGVDLLQWVRTDAGWRLVSFATQYEREELALHPDHPFATCSLP